MANLILRESFDEEESEAEFRDDVLMLALARKAGKGRKKLSIH